MEFRETLLAAQRNQQQKSSDNYYYKARFDPPKKEQKAKDRLSANIQKFLAKKDEEERQKKLEQQRKRDELFAMRDSKALKKIQKTLKVIKSANKSVIADAIDHDNTAVTREGPDQPDQDDYGYESQEAAALYEKMMQKYSKLPDEPKFPAASNFTILSYIFVFVALCNLILMSVAVLMCYLKRNCIICRNKVPYVLKF